MSQLSIDVNRRGSVAGRPVHERLLARIIDRNRRPTGDAVDFYTFILTDPEADFATTLDGLRELEQQGVITTHIPSGEIYRGVLTLAAERVEEQWQTRSK